MLPQADLNERSQLTEVLLLVVTMTGTAEMLAEDLVAEYGAEHAIRMVLAERCTPEQLQQASTLLVISSTYGAGEVPDPGKPLFEALEKDPAQLAHLRFGVVSLGDSIYADTFARGGLLWDGLLAAGGAQRMAEPLRLDASSGEDPRDKTLPWVRDWLQALAGDTVQPEHAARA
jgi:MioC protein